MRLLNVELKRFWSRRLVWITGLALVGIMGFTVVGAYFSSIPPSTEELAEQEMYYQEELADWEVFGEEMVAECLEDQEAERLQTDDPTLDYGCEEMGPPVRESFGWQPTFVDDAQFLIGTMALTIVAGGVLIGASLIAAEINTGALDNWLTFEPRRTRVFFSKLLGVAVGIIPVGLATVLALVGGTLGAYALNDAIGTTSAGFWGTLIWGAVRIVLMTMVGAVAGITLGTLMKHTAAALGAVIGYVLVFEALIGGLLPKWQPWLISTNIQGFLDRGTTYSFEVCKPIPTGVDCEWITKDLSFMHSTVFLAVLLAVFVIAAWQVFRHRDVN